MFVKIAAATLQPQPPTYPYPNQLFALSPPGSVAPSHRPAVTRVLPTVEPRRDPHHHYNHTASISQSSDLTAAIFAIHHLSTTLTLCPYRTGRTVQVVQLYRAHETKPDDVIALSHGIERLKLTTLRSCSFNGFDCSCSQAKPSRPEEREAPRHTARPL